MRVFQNFVAILVAVLFCDVFFTFFACELFVSPRGFRFLFSLSLSSVGVPSLLCLPPLSCSSLGLGPRALFVEWLAFSGSDIWINVGMFCLTSWPPSIHSCACLLAKLVNTSICSFLSKRANKNLNSSHLNYCNNSGVTYHGFFKGHAYGGHFRAIPADRLNFAF